MLLFSLPRNRTPLVFQTGTLKKLLKLFAYESLKYVNFDLTPVNIDYLKFTGYLKFDVDFDYCAVCITHKWNSFLWIHILFWIVKKRRLFLSKSFRGSQHYIIFAFESLKRAPSIEHKILLHLWQIKLDWIELLTFLKHRKAKIIVFKLYLDLAKINILFTFKFKYIRYLFKYIRY